MKKRIAIILSALLAVALLAVGTLIVGADATEPTLARDTHCRFPTAFTSNIMSNQVSTVSS